MRFDPNYIIFVIIGIISLILLWTLLIKYRENSSLSFITKTFLITNVINTLSYTLNWSYHDENGIQTLYYSDTMCQIQGYVKAFSNISLFCWWLSYEVSQYLVIIKNVPTSKIANIKCKIMFYTFFTFFPLLFGFWVLNPKTDYILWTIDCWINGDQETIISCFWFLRFISVICIIFITIKQLIILCNLQKNYDIQHIIGICKSIIIGIYQVIQFIMVFWEIYNDTDFYVDTIFRLYSEVWQGILYPFIILLHDIIITNEIQRLLQNSVMDSEKSCLLNVDVDDNVVEIMRDYISNNLIEETDLDNREKIDKVENDFD